MPYSKHTIIKCASVFIISVALSLFMLVAINTKPDMQNATMTDLVAINGIGEVLACEIYDYVKLNPSCEVGDLIVIDGIGQVRLAEIERTFR